MFERYTEKARRTVFFARYEASQFGCPYIEAEHLLLGLLREDKSLAIQVLSSNATIEAIRRSIAQHVGPGPKVETSVDLPLSHESKRPLVYASEESVRLNHKHIDTPHLLLGLRREENSFAAKMLNEHGVTLDSVREQVRSPCTGSFSAVPKRCDDYIAEGIAEVWLLDPGLKRAYTVTKTDGLREFKGEILRTGDPPLEMDLRRIFS